MWVLGTSGADSRKSAGNGKLVYAMRVDEVLSRSEYYKDPRFAEKKPLANGSYKEQQGDNVWPHGEFERDKNSTSWCHGTSTTSGETRPTFHWYSLSLRRKKKKSFG